MELKVVYIQEFEVKSAGVKFDCSWCKLLKTVLVNTCGREGRLVQVKL